MSIPGRVGQLDGGLLVVLRHTLRVRQGDVGRLLEGADGLGLSVGAHQHLHAVVEVPLAVVPEVQHHLPAFVDLQHAHVQGLHDPRVDDTPPRRLLDSQRRVDLVAQALHVEDHWLLLPLDVAGDVEVEGALLLWLEVHRKGHGAVRANDATHGSDRQRLKAAFLLEAGSIDGKAEGDMLLVHQLHRFRGDALQQALSKVQARQVHADARLLHRACDQEVFLHLRPQKYKRPEGLLGLAALG
mmetsp:Transcript_24678/g.58587  ORF Transcript_24678/g.58587 Transcript_24678/m.58587 type:complete len:242 (-) Transcript_24678:6351-7076(-)